MKRFKSIMCKIK